MATSLVDVAWPHWQCPYQFYFILDKDWQKGPAWMDCLCWTHFLQLAQDCHQHESHLKDPCNVFIKIVCEVAPKLTTFMLGRIVGSAAKDSSKGFQRITAHEIFHSPSMWRSLQLLSCCHLVSTFSLACWPHIRMTMVMLWYRKLWLITSFGCSLQMSTMKK